MSFPKYIRLDEQQKRRVPASAWTTVALGNSALYFAFPFNQNHNNNCTRARLIRNCKQLCVQRLLRSQSWQPPEEAASSRTKMRNKRDELNKSRIKCPELQIPRRRAKKKQEEKRQ